MQALNSIVGLEMDDFIRFRGGLDYVVGFASHVLVSVASRQLTITRPYYYYN